jgi:2-(1,2-epoxy-1,2-dihydrophenyl)acetyl-CoA isomerase
MSEVSGEGVLIDAVDGVLQIRLDRPERKNALPLDAISRINRALEDAATDDALRAVVIRSTGPDFCTGAALGVRRDPVGARPRTGSIQRRTPVQAHRLIELLMEIQLPVVAVVRGWAAGLGCQLALASDFAIAAESARFWEPFLERGFSPDSGSTWLLPRFIGIARAKEMLLLGRKVTGTEAADWGLIHRAVPDDELDAAADELVARLAAGPTVAIGLTKRGIHRALEGSFTEAMEAESNALELSSRTTDFKEGLTAFRESRPPDFTGL